MGFNASGETDGGLGVAVYYELVDDVTPNAYEEAWDIIDTDGTATSGSPTVIGGGSGANMFVYTSPDFGGATVKAAVVPSGNSAGSGTQTDFAIAISPEAVEGLT